MSLIKLNENRYIHMSRIAEIEYAAPHLNIALLSGQSFQLDGEEADRVWSSFQKTQQVDQQESNPGTESYTIHVQEGSVAAIEPGSTQVTFAITKTPPVPVLIRK